MATKVTERKISDYKQDQRNINQGSAFGNHLLKTSIQKTGLGRSIVVDKNDNIMNGNKTAEAAFEAGIENVIEVETDGKTLVVVKRKDLDINTKKGIEHKILDNTVSKHNYVEDIEVMDALCEEISIEPVKYGLPEAGAGPMYVQNEDSEDFEVPMFEGGQVQPKGDGSAKQFTQQMFPVGIVIDKQGQIKWTAYKNAIGISRDSDAFMYLLNSAK